MPIEMIILLILASYFIIGTSQIFSALRIKKVASSLKFPKKDFFVSVIIPIKAVLHTTLQNLESVCKQDYPNLGDIRCRGG